MHECSPTAMNAYIPYIREQAGRQVGGGSGTETSEDVMVEENSEIFQLVYFIAMFSTMACLPQAQCHGRHKKNMKLKE